MANGVAGGNTTLLSLVLVRHRLNLLERDDNSDVKLYRWGGEKLSHRSAERPQIGVHDEEKQLLMMNSAICTKCLDRELRPNYRGFIPEANRGGCQQQPLLLRIWQLRLTKCKGKQCILEMYV